MNNIEKAVAFFNNGYNCSQSILATFAPQLGLDEKTALKIACGFGGGMGRQGNTCGAVSGAYMVLGLKFGETNAENKNAKADTYKHVQEFAELFQARNKTTRCNDLLGYDISSPEDRQIITGKNLFNTLCPGLVKDAAEILQKMLDESD
ncbi:C_GCAxxG_C_C family protein [candidate division KSB1 bacterium]|nr:C_GCAxxG_C_C family protein [candidate division KSB1 bacterium]